MTPKEILRSSLLDIVFQDRNKSYGAYTLRKFYHGRLMMAVGSGLSFVIVLSLFVHFSRETVAGPSFLPDRDWVNITPVEFEEEKPPEVHAAQPVAKPPSVQYNNYQIVDNHEAMTDNPTVDELESNAISTVTNEVPDYRGQVPHTVTEVPVSNTPAVATEESSAAPIQRQPEFPGGREAWMKFLSKYLTVPEELGYGERRTVLVKFLVSEDGSITQFAVMQSGGKAFDNEVIRVLKKMPKWNPAVQNGRNISVTFTQPVTFQSIEE